MSRIKLDIALWLFCVVVFAGIGVLALDCSPNSSTGLKAECWDELKMEAYINEWVKVNETTALCSSLGFAQCFLQAHGYGGLTCDLITSNTCPPFPTTSTYASNQEFYALWNIYSIYQFFNQYSTALTAGASLAGQTIGDIVSAVSVPVESPVHESAIITMIAASLGYVGHQVGYPIPGNPGRIPNIITSAITTILLLDEGLTSRLVKPSQKADDRFVELGQIGTSLAQFVVQFQDNILNVVKAIQGNATLFLTLCKDGAFSQRITSPLTHQEYKLFRQLQTFILSQTLKASGMVVTRSTGINALDEAKRTKNVNCPSLGVDNNCNQWWIDTETNNTYSFHNPHDPENDQVHLMNKIVKQGWANLSEIFKIENCAYRKVTFDPTNLNVNCMVNHAWCEYNYTATMPDMIGHQFTNCDDDPKWGHKYFELPTMPMSYLGPLLYQDDYFTRSMQEK